jgi:DNA-binding transcriptional regulator YhcF (GntR family)
VGHGTLDRALRMAQKMGLIEIAENPKRRFVVAGTEPPETPTERVARVLRSLIQTGQWSARMQLATQPELAELLQASRWVVGPAARQLRDEGLLRGGGHGRPFVVVDQNNPEPTPATAVDQVAEVLLAGIHGGRWPPGTPLPPIRVLRSQLRKPDGSCYADTTVARALRRLRDDGELLGGGHARRFVVPNDEHDQRGNAAEQVIGWIEDVIQRQTLRRGDRLVATVIAQALDRLPVRLVREVLWSLWVTRWPRRQGTLVVTGGGRADHSGSNEPAEPDSTAPEPGR